MARHGFRLALLALVIALLAEPSFGNILFSSLKKSLTVTASAKHEEILKAGEDKITVTWALNKSAGSDSDFKTVKVKLCFAPISQEGRPWRKTEEELFKDKTCKFKIVGEPYTASSRSIDWPIERDVPQGTYFVRVYAFDAHDHQVAYGQSTDGKKSTNLFTIQAISGRHMSMDIASVCFSAFSVLALTGFFIAEKRKAKSSEQK